MPQRKTKQDTKTIAPGKKAPTKKEELLSVEEAVKKISKNEIRRLCLISGVLILKSDAKNVARAIVVDTLTKTIRRGIRFTLYNKRKTLQASDIKFALESMGVSMVSPKELVRMKKKSRVKINAKKKEVETSAPGHRFKPGTVTRREITRFQRMSASLTLRILPFQKLVRSIIRELGASEQIQRIQKKALIDLQFYIENLLIDLFQTADFLSEHAGRKSVFDTDLQAAYSLKNNIFGYQIQE